MHDLVCLHGATSGPATWEPLRAGLTALGYRPHCPTLLGHHDAGRRDTYPLEAFRDQVFGELDRLGPAPVTLVGHSLGAVVATLVAAARPERVARLVLEELPVLRRDAGDGPPVRSRRTGLALRAYARVRPGRVDPRLARDVLAALRAPSPDWWRGLARITAPTLLITGGDASHLDQSRYALVERAVGDASVVTVDVGHRVHSRAPERWLAAVTAFLPH
ncbi:alpha/beta fold hydrolase [Actinocatenispora rupis]|uniref:AB hydrolase-1 domain-containing protein n=1 Tax=Actinocatenispora rupis TaxID=519421 RepID=A0A8J3J1Q3_9ACTN|nr:alpha/beta hydrolase [Actinocatenispora rupis]GID09886.1 hypothetical protein Aru02nite_07750 [Actinocatenispora rupis]